jgi:hypothetical protein
MNYLQVIFLFKMLGCLSYAFCLDAHTWLTMRRTTEIQTTVVKTRSREVTMVLMCQSYTEKGNQDHSQGVQVAGPYISLHSQ